MLYKVSYSPELGSYGRNVIKVELDFSNHATKFDLKLETGTYTSQSAKMIDLANIKSIIILDSCDSY